MGATAQYVTTHTAGGIFDFCARNPSAHSPTTFARSGSRPATEGGIRQGPASCSSEYKVKESPSFGVALSLCARNRNGRYCEKRLVGGEGDGLIVEGPVVPRWGTRVLPSSDLRMYLREGIFPRTHIGARWPPLTPPYITRNIKS